MSTASPPPAWRTGNATSVVLCFKPIPTSECTCRVFFTRVHTAPPATRRFDVMRNALLLPPPRLYTATSAGKRSSASAMDRNSAAARQVKRVKFAKPTSSNRRSQSEAQHNRRSQFDSPIHAPQSHAQYQPSQSPCGCIPSATHVNILEHVACVARRQGDAPVASKRGAPRGGAPHGRTPSTGRSRGTVASGVGRATPHSLLSSARSGASSAPCASTLAKTSFHSPLHRSPASSGKGCSSRGIPHLQKTR